MSTKPSLRILVVDDEENIRHLLTLILTRAGYTPLTAANGREALARLQEADVALCDVRMPELDGLAFLAALPAGAPPVIMMSAYGTTDTALEAMRRGAYDYISKPFRADEVVLTLKKLEERENLLAERGRLVAENASLRQRMEHPVPGFIGDAPRIRELLRILVRAAPHDTTVLITGESGTGKEVLARAVHQLSPRADKPFVAVNCAAIPETLLESELFGYVRGAFTGAVQSHAGLFEQAEGGTLFLDEIGDLPPALQAKLLRVLAEGTLRRIGAKADTPVDVRVVAASAQSLQPPRFREDLFYRLAVVHLQLPPLRARREDIPPLVSHLVDVIARRLRVRPPLISEAALQVLVAHTWPGNVRQLENVLERALLLCDGERVLVEDLPAELLQASSGIAGAPVEPQDLSIPRQTAALERRLIQEALASASGNKAAASRMLEISYKALLYKIREYGIEP